MKRRGATRRGRTLAAGLLLLASLLTGALTAAQTIAEYPLPSGSSGPNNIVNGRDGGLWFTAGKQIGRISPAGEFTMYPFPPNVAGSVDITLGADGALWFSVCGVYVHQPVEGGSQIGRMTPSGEFRMFPLPTAASCPLGIAAGPDGNLWFTERDTARIGRITPSGAITEFLMPQGGAPGFIAAGADDHLWYSSVTTGRTVVGRISTSGEFTEFQVGNSQSPRCPNGLTVGPDGEIWFVEGCSSFGAAVSRITSSGAVTTFPLPSPGCSPQHITTGPDGALWFTEEYGNRVGRMSVDGTLTEYALPAPGSYPAGITVGPDKAIWFAESGQKANRIGRISVPGFVSSTVRLEPTEVSLTVGQRREIAVVVGAAVATATGVSLTGSSPGLVYVPASVVVPVGQTRAAFEIVGLAPGFTRITARLEDGTESDALNVTLASAAPLTTQLRLIPIVLDVTTPIAHYTTELTLTNASPSAVTALLTFTASLGFRDGSGTVPVALAAGEQRIVADAISELRTRGLAIPDPATGPQGGVLHVGFFGDRELASTSVGVLARTTTATVAPQPVGSAGLAYLGLQPQHTYAGSATLFGLRADATDRTNVALFNGGSVPVRVRVSLSPGSGTGPALVFREAEELPPYGWIQYGSSELLGGAGLSNAWVTLERVSAEGAFGAYAVINDNTTSDGSFLLAEREDAAGSALTVPVLVETPSFRTELVLSNRGSSTATLRLRYRESLTPSLGSGGAATVELGAGRQLILPEAVEFLREKAVPIGAQGSASYAGSLRIEVSGVAAGFVSAAARTASRSPAGGQFGLFTPAVRDLGAATARAFLLGLRDDEVSRSNVAVVNAGGDDLGSVTISLQAFDAETGGIPRGEPEVVTLGAGEWRQWGRFLASKGVRNGWVRIDRTSGIARWIAYGVINDGAWPGERTGDGAYVPMVVGQDEPASPSASGKAAQQTPAQVDDTREEE